MGVALKGDVQSLRLRLLTFLPQKSLGMNKKKTLGRGKSCSSIAPPAPGSETPALSGKPIMDYN